MDPRRPLRRADVALRGRGIRAFVDTNVVVYGHDVDEPAKRERAIEVLGDPSLRLVLSTQVLIEAFNALTRRLARPKPPDEAREAIDDLAHLEVVSADTALVLSAIELSTARQLSIWDAMIVRAAQAGRCDLLLTEDLQDRAVHGDVTVENPFRDL